VLKKYFFKHTCNDDNDIGRRKQQKLDYRMFTCKFVISYHYNVSRSYSYLLILY